MNCQQAGCQPLPPVTQGDGPCHCAACHQTFGTLGLFDAHQDWPARGPLVCATPEALGLVRDHKGTWQTPAGLQARRANAARLSEARRSR